MVKKIAALEEKEKERAKEEEMKVLHSAIAEELKDNKMQLNNSRLASTPMRRDNNRLRSQLSTTKHKVEAEKNRHRKRRLCSNSDQTNSNQSLLVPIDASEG